MERELYPFEIGIASRFRAGGKAAIPHKAEWIRSYLLMFGEGNPYSMWKEYKEFCELLGVRPGSYLSFARYMWILKKLGLITVSRREPTKGIPKTYYRINRMSIDSPLWRRPEQSLYPSVDWKLKPPEVKRAYKKGRREEV